MESIIAERQLSPAQEDELSLREMAPEKFESFDPYVEFKVNQKAADPVDPNGYGVLSREQTAILVAASKAEKNVYHTDLTSNSSYPTMTREKCEELIAEHYKYIENEKLKKGRKDVL